MVCVVVVVEFRLPIQLLREKHVLEWVFFNIIWWNGTYIPIIAPKTSSQANFLWGVAAEAELLRPAMPVLDQNSWTCPIKKSVYNTITQYFARNVWSQTQNSPSKSPKASCSASQWPYWLTKAVVGVSSFVGRLNLLICHGGNIWIARQNWILKRFIMSSVTTHGLRLQVIVGEPSNEKRTLRFWSQSNQGEVWLNPFFIRIDQTMHKGVKRLRQIPSKVGIVST